MKRRSRAYLVIGIVVFLFAAIAVHVRSAFAGSQFYLTIERSYSSSEPVDVRLDYTKNQEPLTLRVLKPKNLERFLEGQLNISRAYEEPVATINPGHFVVDGMNVVDSPLVALRNALTEDFRMTFGGDEFNGAVFEPNPNKPLRSPAEIVHSAPAGFEVVREVYVDLQRGGAQTENPAWFWGGEDESYKIRSVQLEPLPDGVYLLQGLQGKVEAQALLQVSSLSVQVKQSSEQLLVRTVDRGGEPVAGAKIAYRDGRGKWRDAPASTNEMGELSFRNPEGILDGRLLVRVEASNERRALVETDFLPAVSSDSSVYIATDRPIFKPGEEFYFKGTVRDREQGALVLPKGGATGEAHVSLVRADGAPTDLTTTAKLTEFGTFSGSFELPSFQSPGLYRLIAEIGGKPYGGELRVKDYVKPKFYLEILKHDPTLRPGEKFSFTLRARNFSGTVPEQVKYEVFVYRKKFEAPQFVLESGGGIEAGHDYFGEIRSATALTQPQRMYSSVEVRAAAANQDASQIPNPWDTAPELEGEGEGTVEIELPKPAKEEPEGEWTYTLVVRAQDFSGSSAVISENFYQTLSEAVASVVFPEPVVEEGAAEIALGVRSTYPGGDKAASGGGRVDLSLEKADGKVQTLPSLSFKTDEDGIARLKLAPPKEPGRLRAVAVLDTLAANKLAHPAKSEPAIVIVGAKNGQAVISAKELELFTKGTILSPGEKAKVLAVLPEHWGKNEKGVLWQSTAGRELHTTAASRISGRSIWVDVEAKPEYGTGFYQTFTIAGEKGKFAEQTVGFRIVPDDKRLTVRVQPSSDTAEPLKQFRLDFEVLDSSGKGAADTELSVGIVDKAVYSVQSEFRPDVLEFFYPLPRMNLGTFYSDELQGYGYADEIKRPNFNLAALKSRSQPAKRAMRDTAAWFPHVRTDASGKASVTAEMPANITEWIVTAIASDKTGRVGEGHGKFRSATDVNVDAEFPSFLRKGDEATGSFRTQNQTDKELPLSALPGKTGAVALVQDGQKSDLKVPPKSDARIPLTLSSDASEGEAILRVALSTQAPVRTGGAQEYDLKMLPSAMRQTLVGAWDPKLKNITFPLPEEGTVADGTLLVTSNLLGSALSAARELVSYPYGCTEQLVHTTLPNLVLLKLLTDAKIDEKGFLLSRAFSEAQQNAEAGIQKLVRNQKANGGFVLWGSEKEPSFPLTIVVARALNIADSLDVPGAQRASYAARAWIATELESSKDFSAKNALSGYQLATLAEMNFLSQLKDSLIAYVNEVVADEAAPLESTIFALQILKKVENQWWLTDDMRTKESTEILLTRLDKKLKQFDEAEYFKRVSADFDALGFGFGRPTLVSAALGVLHSFEKLTPEMKTRLEGILTSDLKDGIWTSTFETGQIILNTREILKDEAEAIGEAGTRTISAVGGDGSPLGTLTVIPGGLRAELAHGAPLSALQGLKLNGLRPNERVISVVHADVPFAKLKSTAEGMTISRRLMKVTPTGNIELFKGEGLHQGDTVISEVTLSRPEQRFWGALASSFVVVEDGIPSLGQGIEDDRTALADAKLEADSESFFAELKDTQRFPEKTVRVLKLAPGGTIRLYNVWRAAFKGKASLPPARAFDMYDEALSGNTTAQEVTVE